MNYSVLVRRNGVIPTILFFLMISVIAADAWSADTDRLIIDLGSAQFNISNWGRDVKSNISILGGMFLSGAYPTNSWEVEQYSPNSISYPL